MTDGPRREPSDVDGGRLVAAIDADLRARGRAERAERERAYLKSELVHYGTAVPDIRKAVRRVTRQHPELGHDELIASVEALWAEPVHERRMAAVLLLDRAAGRLGPGDLALLEQLLRDSRTWALVDGLAVWVAGRLIAQHPELADELDRWASDDDCWVRRAALLALLPALRQGAGDFERFARYADAMLEEREFFIRKAIGWVLRDTAKKRPDLVYEWLLPRARRASGVTVREAVKPLSDQQRAAVLAARRD